MVRIHGLAYIIIGFFVFVISTTNKKFIVFFYIGLIFIFVGIAKLIFNLIKKRMNKTKMSNHKSHSHSQHFKQCHKCGNFIGLHDRFCNRCGARL